MEYMKYLLLKIKGNRSFLTHEKNLNSLIEFAKTFSAEIYRVEAPKQKVLELKALVNAICDQDYEEKPTCRNMKKVFPEASKSRASIIRNAQRIRKFIYRKLSSGKALSLRELKEKYVDWNITDACLCSHLTATRKLLAREGYHIKKLGAGNYVAQKPD